MVALISDNAAKFRSLGKSPLISCPVINWTLLELILLVNGIPIAAAEANAEVTPGIISYVIFESFKTVSSSSNLPKRPPSPDFNLTTLNPLDAYSTNSRETSICLGDFRPALLPTLIKSASGLTYFKIGPEDKSSNNDSDIHYTYDDILSSLQYYDLNSYIMSRQ